jgi:hypothetical protein
MRKGVQICGRGHNLVPTESLHIMRLRGTKRVETLVFVAKTCRFNTNDLVSMYASIHFAQAMVKEREEISLVKASSLVLSSSSNEEHAQFFDST